jgi:hypothetical protein
MYEQMGKRLAEDGYTRPASRELVSK